jgi:O-antigen/teichoic acid export membrane protein
MDEIRLTQQSSPLRHLANGLTAAIAILGHSSQQFAGLVITLLAAGFLGAAEFGTYALAIVFVEFVVMLTYAGFYHFIVTSDAEDTVVISTLFWVLLAIGVIGGLAMITLATPCARLFDAPDLAPALRVFGLLQPVASVIGWASAVLTRTGRMRRLYGAQIGTNLGGLAVGVGLLFVWQSLFALVAYQAARSLIGLVLFWRATPHRPQPLFDRALFRSAARYALGLYGARSLTFLSVFGVDLLLALLFSTAESGLYRFANRLATASVDIIAQPLRSFCLKGFGQAARTDAPLTPLFTRYFAGGVVLTGLVGLTIACLGGAVIDQAFQPEFLLATGAVQALALRAVARIGQTLVEPTFSATRRTSVAFANNLVVASVMILTIVAVAPMGFVTVAWAQAAVQLASVPFSVWMIARFAPVQVGPGLAAAAKGLVLLAGFAAVLWMGWAALSGLPPALRLASGLALAATLSALTVTLALRLRILSPGLFTDGRDTPA